ncbi:alpha/beta hydrolase domain-containing protein [Bryobacter aggregatus]|uniref:alpha/beta hydrolase domain-containing protein n=1 Tax=Bryobacter aggregatus TaxID=360054 RepID=UPI00068A61B4|nr:alpha/beta hydrolase domain-containing protein [Bryobacter aggregatus]
MRIALFLLFTSLSFGAVTKIYVEDRGDVEGGKSFGSPGPYERVVAKAHFAIDPKLPANQIIRDLDRAPVDDKGLVRFSADLYVLKPRDPSKGNGSILFEVSNRGGKGLLSMFQGSNSYLMEQGYTLVWVGWQWDVPASPELLRVYPPIAQGVEALIRSEFVPHAKALSMSLGDRNMQAYPVASGLKLTIRDSRDGKRQEIGEGWQLNTAKTAIEMPGGFQPYQIYEATYQTRNPAVSGTGLAAIRDVISFLKYENNGLILLGDQARYLKRAIAFGTSQSGRLLRQFLYDGFNSDEKGRKVFEGVWANVAGAGRGSFNIRGAQPSRDGHPTFNFFYPSDIFPFSDLAQTDPETGITDGLLTHTKDVPKIFYTNGSYEYWGRNGALIHITPDGKADAPIAPLTRIYFVAGSQHGPGTVPPPMRGSTNFSNMNDYRPLYRALLARLEAWIKDGTAPPDSVYPRIAKGELVPFEQLKIANAPKQPMRSWRVDYRTEPPVLGKIFPMLVPAVDQDGNEVGGVRMPEVAVPLATYTGWNYVADPAAPKNLINDMVGSTLPFSASEVKRRYGTREKYQSLVRTKAVQMVEQGFLLEPDVNSIVDRAGRAWDWLLSSK